MCTRRLLASLQDMMCQLWQLSIGANLGVQHDMYVTSFSKKALGWCEISKSVVALYRDLYTWHCRGIRSLLAMALNVQIMIAKQKA